MAEEVRSELEKYGFQMKELGEFLERMVEESSLKLKDLDVDYVIPYGRVKC